jgi:hypothetical protein
LLLCTSQQTAAAVKQSCICRLHLKADTPAQMAWFGQNWPLVRSLHWPGAGCPDCHMFAALEDVLAAAAAR